MDYQDLDVELPPNFQNYNQIIQLSIIEYLKQLNPIEKKPTQLVFNI